MTRNDRHLSLDDLRAAIDAGTLDTVIVAFTDMRCIAVTGPTPQPALIDCAPATVTRLSDVLQIWTVR